MAYQPTYSLGGYNSNPLVWADRLNNNAPAAQYDPNAYVDPRQIAAQTFALQQQLSSQQFNRENPQMALPQNFGNFLSQAVQKIGGFGSGAPQQAPQGGGGMDPTSAIQGYIDSVTHQNIMNQLAAGSPVDHDAAQYAAATQALTDPTVSKLPGVDAIVNRYMSDLKKNGYTPQTAEAAAAASSERAVKTADLQAKAIYQVVDRGQGDDGLPTYNTMGTAVPMFVNGKMDPDYQNKIDAQVQAAKAAGAKNPQPMMLGDIDNLKAPMEQYRASMAAERQKAQDEAREKANNEVDDTLAQFQGHALARGDMTSSDFKSKDSAQFRAAQKYAFAEDPNWSSTDNDVRKKALNVWLAGADHQSVQKMQTSVGHLEDIRKYTTALGNGDSQAANFAKNKIETWLGQPIPAQFDLAKSIFADELISSIKQRGGNEQDVTRVTSAMPNWASPTQLSGVIDQEENQWAKRVNSADYSYQTAIDPKGTGTGKHFLGDVIRDPQSAEVYSKYYPVQLGTDLGSKSQYNHLPKGTWYTYGGKTVQKATNASY